MRKCVHVCMFVYVCTLGDEHRGWSVCVCVHGGWSVCVCVCTRGMECECVCRLAWPFRGQGERRMMCWWVCGCVCLCMDVDDVCVGGGGHVSKTDDWCRLGVRTCVGH